MVVIVGIRCSTAARRIAFSSKNDSRPRGVLIMRSTLPLLMQLVQTRTFFALLLPSILALTGRRLTFQRRRVTLCACEMLLPNCGPLPQISQTCAMTDSKT